MKRLESIRKLVNEKPDPNQLWTVMTYLLSRGNRDKNSEKDKDKKGNEKDNEKDDNNENVLGYFIFLRSFPNKNLAEKYIEEIIQRTGIESLIAIPSCFMLPISKESMGKVIPVNVNKEGKLISIAKERDSAENERERYEEKINRIKDQDQKDLSDTESIPSIARNWFLYIKYQKLKHKYEEDLRHTEEIIQKNDEKIKMNLDRIPEIIKYLEDRLIMANEKDLLELMKKQITEYSQNH